MIPGGCAPDRSENPVSVRLIQLAPVHKTTVSHLHQGSLHNIVLPLGALLLVGCVLRLQVEPLATV